MVNLAPCACASSVMYSRTLPQLLGAKPDLDSRMHPPMVIDRFAYLAALVVYKKYTPSAARAQNMTLPHTAPTDGN
ncbi:MAG: hypothetical protein IJW08_07480 [Lentisphaeria bacterium]|nr:hypothetical protein [Lentisphaeria bacterium]